MSIFILFEVLSRIHVKYFNIVLKEPVFLNLIIKLL